MKNDTVHKFELSGLGKAPFKLVGFFQMPSPELPNYNQALGAMPKDVSCGSCDYCGTGLKNNFIIESANNIKSVVGCDCVSKIGDLGLTSKIKEMQRADRAQKRVAKRTVEFEVKLASQRVKNGGKTDCQLRHEAIEARNAIISKGKAKIKVSLEDIVRALGGSVGDFARNMYTELRDVNFGSLSPNMERIICEIAAKHMTGARKGSKIYTVTYDRLRNVMSHARSENDSLLESNPVPR